MTSDEYKQEARKIVEERFGMSLEKLPVHVQPSAYAEMREIACKTKLSALEAQLSQLQLSMVDLLAAEESLATLRAQITQLQATVGQLRDGLERMERWARSNGHPKMADYAKDF